MEYLLLLAHDPGYLKTNIYQAMQSDLVDAKNA
jgi:hypothetical protein